MFDDEKKVSDHFALAFGMFHLVGVVFSLLSTLPNVT